MKYKNSYGFILTLIGAFIILIVFYGKIFKDPNNIYFAPGGDGLQAYYGAIFHLEYDTAAYRMNGMNYPYGEMVYFTGCQPLLVNSVRFISEHFIDISDHIVGIINVLMLLSIAVATIFIFLIFRKLNVVWWFSALVALGMVMLSPQIGRMGGHFSLSYLFWLPLIIWLLLKFDEKRSWKLSMVIGLITYWAAATHMYFFGLFGFLFLFYWAHILLKKEFQFKSYKWMLHVFIQVIVPFLIVQLFIELHDNVADRTSHPWGFFAYRAHLASVLLPLHKPYARFLMAIGKFRYDWEAFAFIGMVALSGLIVGVVGMIRRIKARKNIWVITDHQLINVLFWASVASLMLSFSLPFGLGLHGLLEYMGPLKQLRALARFSWLFYYMLNILVFYGIYKLIQKKTLLTKLIAGIAVLFLFYDGYLNVTQYNKRLVNRISELDDRENALPQNQWVHEVVPEDYQAILPLPYFHIGSENVWLNGNCGIERQNFIVSLKTGLPSFGVILSRTSLSQTYKSLQMVSKPFRPLNILEDLPNEKPLLLLVGQCDKLSETEKLLVSQSILVWKGEQFVFYRLELDVLRKHPLLGQQAYNEEVQQAKSQLPGCIFEEYEEQKFDDAYEGEGAYTGRLSKWNNIFERKLKGVKKGEKYLISFWVKEYKKDRLPRTTIELLQYDNEELKNSYRNQLQRLISRFDGDWMQVEIPIEIKADNEWIKVSLRQRELKGQLVVVDNLMIRPVVKE